MLLNEEIHPFQPESYPILPEASQDPENDVNFNEEDATRIREQLAYESSQQGYKCKWCPKTYAKNGICLTKHENSCRNNPINQSK